MSKQRHVAEGERVPPKEGKQTSFYAFTLKTDSKNSSHASVSVKHPCPQEGSWVIAKRLVSPSDGLDCTRPHSEQSSLTDSQSKCRGSVSCLRSLHGMRRVLTSHSRDSSTGKRQNQAPAPHHLTQALF